MNAITIPKEITGGEELVIIPRKLYEEFLREQKKKSLNKELEEALEDVKQGRMIGPFSSWEEGVRALKQAK